MKTKFNLFFILVFLIMVMGLASAAPPGGTPVTQTADTGIFIAYPKYDYIPQGQGFDLHAHVINTTSQLTNLTTSCWLHLYTPNGEHTMKSNMSFANGGLFEFEVEVDGNNFSSLGTHSYIIECFTSNEAGFASGVFTVTPTGNQYSIYLIIIIIILAIVLFIFSVINSNPYTGFAASSLFIVAGIWIMINGIDLIINEYTRMLSFVILGFGLMAIFASVYEMFRNGGNE